MAIVLALAFCALTSQSAMAQSDLGFKGIGAAVGVVSPEDLDATFGIGMIVDHGTIIPELGLETRLDYWSKSEDTMGSEVSVRDITLGTRGKYFFELTNSSIRPFAGAGLGLHFLNAEVTVTPPPGFPGPTTVVEDSSTKLGLDLGGGIAAPVGPRTNLLAEMWYGIVSDFSQFSLRVGMSYKLGV
jgi:hypothetical protein